MLGKVTNITRGRTRQAGGGETKKKKIVRRRGRYKIPRCKGAEWIGSGDKGDGGDPWNINGVPGRGERSKSFAFLLVLR